MARGKRRENRREKREHRRQIRKDRQATRIEKVRLRQEGRNLRTQTRQENKTQRKGKETDVQLSAIEHGVDIPKYGLEAASDAFVKVNKDINEAASNVFGGMFGGGGGGGVFKKPLESFDENQNENLIDDNMTKDEFMNSFSNGVKSQNYAKQLPYIIGGALVLIVLYLFTKRKK